MRPFRGACSISSTGSSPVGWPCSGHGLLLAGGVEPGGCATTALAPAGVLAVMAVVAGVCDVAENVLVERTISAFRRTGAPRADPDWLFAVAATKYAALAVVVLSLLRLLPQRLPPPLGGPCFRPSTSRPEFLRPAGARPPVGTAATATDAHRRLLLRQAGCARRPSPSAPSQELQRHGVLRRASYLAAVSGGCYLATGLAAARRTDPTDQTTPTAPTTPAGPSRTGPSRSPPVHPRSAGCGRTRPTSPRTVARWWPASPACSAVSA